MQRNALHSTFLIIILSLVILTGCRIIEGNCQYPLDEIISPGYVNNDFAQIQLTFSRKLDDQTIGYITNLNNSEQIEFTLGNKGRDLVVSPESAQVVYSFTETIEDDLRSSLWLYDLNSNEENRVFLWPDSYTDISLSSPNFFPDGQKLVFSINYHDRDTTGLGSIDLEGNNLEIIDTPERTFSIGPKISPDGEKILVLCEGIDRDSGQPGFMLCIMDRDGSHRIRLMENGDFHGTSRFSPDSQAIIYSESEWGGLLGVINPPRYEIKRIDVNGQNEKTILEWHRAVNVLALSEDGDKIVFMDRYEGGKPPRLYVIDADGKNLRHLAYFDEFLAEWYGGN